MALIPITTPDLGGATDVTVIEVLVKPGDTVEANASIVTLESDKATMDIPTSEAGIVKEVKVKVGDKVASGTALITIETKAAAASATIEKHKATTTEATAKETTPPTVATIPPATIPAPATAPSATSAAISPADANVHAGPGVRRFARELGVNIALIAGSGPKQRIVKEDVQAFVKGQLAQIANGMPAATAAMPTIDFSKFGEIETRPLSRINKISGKNLQRNWMMLPHVTQFGEADITDLEAFRQAQKTLLEKEKIKLTPLVFIMKAIATCLKHFPRFNASLDASGDNLILKKYIHIGVAVDTPDGLVVPIIRDVDKKGVIDLAKELAHVSEKARNKQLTPGDMQGGCFSISSLGGIGGTAFTPIINYPEVAILGVSKAAYKPVYEDHQFVPRLMLPLSLSYDHRVIDGAEGARFITHLSAVLSDIRNLIL